MYIIYAILYYPVKITSATLRASNKPPTTVFGIILHFISSDSKLSQCLIISEDFTFTNLILQRFLM